ncbi:MAG: hypothetical protein WC438_06140 [Candidatus Pacearchaeota archaeon]
MEYNLKEIIKDNIVKFQKYQDGIFYYVVGYNHEKYIFPVPLSDVEATEKPTLFAREKAIMFMRYIRKAIEDNTFIKYYEQY